MDIFSPTTFGDLQLSNRVAMAPMTRTRAEEGDVPGEIMAEHYADRASLGLIITEGTYPTLEGKGYTGQPGIVTDEQVAGWRRVADAVHAKGGTIVMQLMHAGRVSHTAVNGQARIVGPSAIAINEQTRTPEGTLPFPVPHELTTAEAHAVIADTVRAAERAVLEAGMDGVELHNANGYLMHQFLSPASNVRTDEFGGSPAARARLGIETAKAVAQAVGAGKVGIRISPMNPLQDVNETDLADVTETYNTLIDGITPLGLAYLSILHTEPTGDLAAALTKRFSGNVILNSGWTDPTDLDEVTELLASGQADAVAVGRLAIANPDLIARWQQKAAVNEPNPATFYADGATGYNDYPTLDEDAA